MTAATPAQPAPVSPHLGCAVCASGVPVPHGAGGTPAQAAYEALHASLLARNPDHNHVPWGELDELTRHADGWYRADFEAAAIAAAPQPVPGDVELRSRLTALAVEHDRTAEAYRKSIPATDPGSADGFRKQAAADAWRSSAAGIRDALRLAAAQPKAAPGLAIDLDVDVTEEQAAEIRKALEAVNVSRAAVAPELGTAWRLADERREQLASVREVVTEILAAFGPSGSGHTARVGQVQIAKWRTRAGLTS